MTAYMLNLNNCLASTLYPTSMTKQKSSFNTAGKCKGSAVDMEVVCRG